MDLDQISIVLRGDDERWPRFTVEVPPELAVLPKATPVAAGALADLVKQGEIVLPMSAGNAVETGAGSRCSVGPNCSDYS